MSVSNVSESRIGESTALVGGAPPSQADARESTNCCMSVSAFGCAVIAMVGGGLTVFCGFPEIERSGRITYGRACSQSSHVLAITYFAISLLTLIYLTCLWKILEAYVQGPVQAAPVEQPSETSSASTTTSPVLRPAPSRDGCSTTQCARITGIGCALVTLEGAI